jgi:hypothetical protein
MSAKRTNRLDKSEDRLSATRFSIGSCCHIQLIVCWSRKRTFPHHLQKVGCPASNTGALYCPRRPAATRFGVRYTGLVWLAAPLFAARAECLVAALCPEAIVTFVRGIPWRIAASLARRLGVSGRVLKQWIPAHSGNPLPEYTAACTHNSGV